MVIAVNYKLWEKKIIFTSKNVLQTIMMLLYYDHIIKYQKLIEFFIICD